MRERRSDTALAVVLALALHALLLGLMFIGLWWTRSAAPVSAAGAPVEATLVSADSLSPAMREVLADRPEPAPPEPRPEPQPKPLPEPVERDTAPPPQPVPEPVPQDAPTPPQPQAQALLPDPADEDQARVVETPTPTPSEEAQLQEERRRQAQVDLTEQKRQREAQRKQRLAEMERMRQEQLAQIRRRQAAAARAAEEAREKLERIAQAQQAADAPAPAAPPPPPGNGGVDTGLKARYAAALQKAIESKWTRPETIPLGATCTLTIKQLPGGEVMSADVVASRCSYGEAGRRSIEAAVLKAQPLPYLGFEEVFARTLTLNFVARDR